VSWFSQSKIVADQECRFLGVFGFLKLFVFLAESLNSACRIDQFLFSGKKRVALGTYFNPDVLLGRSHLDFASAGTLDRRLSVLRMNIGFHFNFNPLYNI
jgi:hypothetical protein